MSEVGGFALKFLRSSVKWSGVVEVRQNYNREKRVCTVSVNQWATNEDKPGEEICGPFSELSGRGEQRCSEPSVVCLRDTEDSQKEESRNNQDVKEQRQRRVFCGTCGQKLTDGTNATEFKVSQMSMIIAPN